MQHFGFIFASYLAAGLIMGCLALWLVFDSRSQKKQLAALEKRGVRRRSASGIDASESQ